MVRLFLFLTIQRLGDDYNNTMLSMHVLADSYKTVLGSRYVPYALLLLPCLTVHGFVLLDNSKKNVCFNICDNNFVQFYVYCYYIQW